MNISKARPPIVDSSLVGCAVYFLV